MGEIGFAVVVTQNNVRLTLVAETSDLSPGISPRELQIAQLVARGATNQAIARALDISILACDARTLERHGSPRALTRLNS